MIHEAWIPYSSQKAFSRAIHEIIIEWPKSSIHGQTDEETKRGRKWEREKEKEWRSVCWLNEHLLLVWPQSPPPCLRYRVFLGAVESIRAGCTEEHIVRIVHPYAHAHTYTNTHSVTFSVSHMHMEYYWTHLLWILWSMMPGERVCMCSLFLIKNILREAKW